MLPAAVAKPEAKRILDLYRRLQQSRARLVGLDGTARTLPASPDKFLAKLIAYLSKEQSVSIVQNDAQLTTVEAGRILGVSRQFLVKLLERGEIPHHMVGTHRRVYVRDLLDYKARRDSNRRKILDE
jgi:excisionase family DNA binding protein